MKRKLSFLLSAVLILSMLGCAGQQGDPVKNEVFTDEYFAGVEQMTLLVMAEPLTGELMDPVIRFLKGLKLTPTETRLSNTNENGEAWDGGPLLLVLEYANGDTKTAFVSTGIITINGGGSYLVEDENFYRGLLESFGKIWEEE